jgi:hypothetical protein
MNRNDAARLHYTHKGGVVGGGEIDYCFGGGVASGGRGFENEGIA